MHCFSACDITHITYSSGQVWFANFRLVPLLKMRPLHMRAMALRAFTPQTISPIPPMPDPEHTTPRFRCAGFDLELWPTTL